MPEWISYVCFALALLQMLVSSIWNVDKLCVSRHKNARKYFILALSAVLLTVLGYFTETVFLDEGGVEVFCIIGALLFFIPAISEYKSSFWRIVEAVCISWIYSFTLFSISTQISRLVSPSMASFVLLITQSGLYALFYLPARSFILGVIRDILDNFSEGVNSRLHATSALWLITFAAVNGCLVFAPVAVAIVTQVCMFILVYLNYTVLHNAFAARNSVRKFRRIAYADDLTGLPNRAAFFSDGQMMIQEAESFGLVFLDLDHFKSINDTYGHLAGNVYLCGFAESLLQLSAGLGKAYRISGDEFAVVVNPSQRTDFVKRLVTYKWPIFVPGQPFLGVAAGYAQWPQDGKTLDDVLLKSDKAMYRQKGNSR